MLKLVFFSKSTSDQALGGRNSYFGDKIKARDVHFGRNEHQQKNVLGLLGCSFKLHAQQQHQAFQTYKKWSLNLSSIFPPVLIPLACYSP